jgi:hypothetical protein
MSEGTVSIDYGYIRQIVNNAVSPIDHNVRVVSNQVQQAQDDIIRLQRELADFRKQQEFAAALQRAITEVIRVRQELEEKFGTHKKVRDNMLGILQANDLALVGQDAIKNCSEELMLSAPNYWLAPSLIALAAWIGNNKSLAERAIKEACKRDEEKTAMLFALICRRNGRTRACFKWLGLYFSKQNPLKMRKSIIAFVDAYSNGVFGNDEEKICDDTINFWMKTLKQENVNFDNEQKAYWSNYYLTMCAGNPSLGADYELLKKVSPQAKAMDEYVERIVAVDKEKGIRENFNEILNAEVNMLSLIDEIDKQLNNLVTAYEEEEEGLRREEQFYTIVKAKSGDEALAKKIMRLQDAKRYDPPVDFAKRLSQSITAQGQQEEAVAMSAKKTALKLLRGYIEGAFEDFILEKKDAYPTEISLVIPEKGTTAGKYTGKNFKWVGKTADGKNNSELHASVGAQYDKAKSESIATVVDKKGGLIGAIIFAVVLVAGIILAAAVEGGFAVLAVIGGIAAIACLVTWRKGVKANKVAREAFAKYYDTAKAKACKIIDEALKARARINDLVAKFESNKNFTKLFEAPVYETSEAEAPAEVENNEEA